MILCTCKMISNLALQRQDFKQTRYIMTKKAKQFLYTFRREALIFFLLFFTLLRQLPEELHGWNSAWYAMDYSLGFDSRLFIGSVLRLFYPDFLPAKAAYRFVFLSLILLLFLLSWVLGYALRQLEGKNAEKGLLLVIALYFLSPGSPSYLWTAENMGRFDMYLLIASLAAVICCILFRSVWLQLILITAWGFIALSIHQAFMFLFFPLFFTLYLKAAMADPLEKGRKPLPVIFAVIGMAGMAAAFLYFQLFSHIRPSSCGDLVSLLASRTDLPLNEVALNYEYFAATAQSFSELVMNQPGERIRYGLVTLLLLAPLALLYGFLWMRILKAAEKKSRPFYALLLLSHLCIVPAFLMAIDWGRWFGAFLTMQALQLVILAAKGDAPVLSALSSLADVFRRHPYIFFLAAVWTGSLDKFQATLLPDAPVFFYSLYELYRFIF